MLKLQYISDLHLEYRSEIPWSKLQVCAPNLALVGDVGHLHHRRYRELLEWANENFEHTFLVLGNHEFYAQPLCFAEATVLSVLKGLSRVHWLNRTTFDHPSKVRIAGATLWSAVTADCFQELRDRRIVLDEVKSPFTHNDYLTLHEADRSFFADTLAEAAVTSTPLVCLSHHAPLLEASGDFGEHRLRCGFCTDLSELFQPPLRAWIHGHTHQSLRCQYNGIPCVSNCLGYSTDAGLDRGFRSDAVICI